MGGVPVNMEKKKTVTIVETVVAKRIDVTIAYSAWGNRTTVRLNYVDKDGVDKDKVIPLKDVIKYTSRGIPLYLAGKRVV